MNPGKGIRQGTRLHGHAGKRHAIKLDNASRRFSNSATPRKAAPDTSGGASGGEGVLYFNVGARCQARLCVSVHSLRKVYEGSVTLVVQGNLPTWARKVMAVLEVRVLDIPQEDASSRTMKASLWRHSPYETTLFLDSDTLVLQDPSLLFPEIRKHGFVVTRFSDWMTTGTGFEGNQFTLRFESTGLAQSAVPEPATFALLGLGSLLLIARRRRC